MKKPYQGCLVPEDEIRPADVLFSRGWQKESSVLAEWATGNGVYSHVSLLTWPFILESDDYGAGQSPLPSVRLKGRTWVFLPYDRGQFTIARHIPWEKRDTEELAESVRIASDKHSGQPYSKLPRLLEASLIPEFLRPIARVILRWKDDRKQDSPIEGVYCSELVTLIFHELGVELASGAGASLALSPNDLANSPALRPVWLSETLNAQEARELDPSVDFAGLLAEYQQNRKEWVGRHAELTEVLGNFGALNEALERQLEANRLVYQEKFRERYHLWRGELLRELHIASRLQNRDWFEFVLKEYENPGDPESALRHLSGKPTEERRSDILEYYSLSVRIIEFAKARALRWSKVLERRAAECKGLRHFLEARRLRRTQSLLSNGLEQYDASLTELARLETQSLGDHDAMHGPHTP